ncbi:ProQ/FINO family protein [Quatrionicoccus australiensis]|uniref:ProQ/FINO family protein n=1 Tax=Quatrionicoccus australiensis TaxID=138118 RepID=UPI001CF9DB5D|nr:ProQ/FINO family protein [Quatrionicoccus australiensis]MCB4359255.1 ProQ activator of osmoprotectant transporter prop [Quatrionicoccus australiensis]
MNTATATPDVVPGLSPRALLKKLQADFPVFRDSQPLAIGIDKQLLARLPDLERKTLRVALGIHTNSLRYLKVMEKATVRFDLDGNTADEVTDAHRAHALEAIRERLKKEADKRRAEKEAAAVEHAAAEAERQRTEKMGQLLAKFGRNS